MTTKRKGWHGESRRHSEVARKGARTRRKGNKDHYFMFYDNITGKNNVAVAFNSERSGENFIKNYQYTGGFMRFNYDYYGTGKDSFINWAKRNGFSTNVIKKSGNELFRYLMSKFER